MAAARLWRTPGGRIVEIMQWIQVCTLGAAIAACRFSPPAGGPEVDATGEPDVVDGPAGAWLQPWRHRKAFAVLASQVAAPGNGALADFPVLVSVVDPEIRAAALPTGADIVFTLGDAVTPLATEIESFTSAGQLVAWVKIPSLSATTDTPLYIYYDNANPPASTAAQVWSDRFVGVWHLEQSPTAGNGEMLDSTAAHRDGDAESSMTAADSIDAQIGRGIHLDGVDDYLGFPQADFGSTFTISMWIDVASAASVRTLLANSASGNGVDGFRLFVNTVGTTDRRLVFETGDPSGNADHAQTPTNAIPFGTWTHVAAVVDRPSGHADLFVDGAKTTERPNTLTDFTADSDFELGRMENNFFELAGALDEVEVAATSRPAEWIRTAFANQSSPGTFRTAFGPEQTASP